MLAELAGLVGKIVGHFTCRPAVSAASWRRTERRRLRFWDLEAKRAGRRAWELAGMQSVTALVTAYTLGLDTAESMARGGGHCPTIYLLKLKLDGDGDLERVAAVRMARPDVRLIVDANESWKEGHLHQSGS